MTRVRIEYFDQNEAFAPNLPRTGRVTRKTRSEHVDNWHLVELDKPVAFENLETTWLLIRSRWQGHEIGEAEPTSVFLLLVKPSQLPLAEPIQPDEYLHVAWGMCHTEQDAAQQGVPGDVAASRRRA